MIRPSAYDRRNHNGRPGPLESAHRKRNVPLGSVWSSSIEARRSSDRQPMNISQGSARSRDHEPGDTQWLAYVGGRAHGTADMIGKLPFGRTSSVAAEWGDLRGYIRAHPPIDVQFCRWSGGHGRHQELAFGAPRTIQTVARLGAGRGS